MASVYYAPPMHVFVVSVMLAAAPAVPAPQLKSLSGLNIAALKPWLQENLPSLAPCVLPSVKEGDDVVTVQAQFSKSPEVTVTRVDAALSDVACVRGVVERWKRDAKQPSAGPFSFSYRFKPNQAQRDAASAQATASFKSLCEALAGGLITAPKLTRAMETARPVLPMGAWISLADAIAEVESLEPAKQSVELSKAMRDAAKSLKAELACAR